MCLILFVVMLGGERLLTPAEAKTGKVDESEVLFTNGIIPRFHIELDRAALASLRQDSHRFVKATVKNGDEVYQDIGLHLKGGLASFRTLDEKPCITLKFNKYVSGQKFHGIYKLHLNNSIQDPTYMTELICGELFREAGVPAPRVTHAIVKLNDSDLGFYVLLEGFDKAFLRRHFNETHGNLYDGGARTDVMHPLQKISGNGPNDHSDLKALLAVGSEPASNRLARLGALLDLDRFYSLLALEVMLCHWDGYTMAQNNYKIYHDPKSNRIVFLPHGMDQMFGRPQGSILPDCAGFVSWCVLSTPIGRQQHRQRCAAFFTDFISSDRLLNRVNQLHEHIRPLLAELAPKQVPTHDGAVEKLKQQIAARLAFLNAEVKRNPLILTRLPRTAKASYPIDDNTPRSYLLTNWVANLNAGEARFAEISEHKPSYQISSIGEHMPFCASWRTRVLLPAGHYQFHANTRTSGFFPAPNAPGGGIWLRVSDYSAPPPLATWAGNVDWRSLTVDVTVTVSEEDVEFVCEVWAFKGTASFAKEALTLTKDR